MLKLGDKVIIKDNSLVGEICDINDGYCYVDVRDLKGIKPDFMDSLFERKIDEVEKIA